MAQVASKAEIEIIGVRVRLLPMARDPQHRVDSPSVLDGPHDYTYDCVSGSPEARSMTVNDGIAYQATDLARNHREVIDAARRGSALIRDKDGLALLMVPAEETRRTREIGELALDLVRAASVMLPGGAARTAAAYGGMAWLSVLPIDAQRRFFREMSTALVVAASGTTLRSVEILLGDWRATAEAWADPDTRERLLADEDAPIHGIEL